MASQLRELDPPIKVGEKGDKLVKVGTLDWLALKHVRNALRRADLPLPDLSAPGFKAELDRFQASFGPKGDVPIMRVVSLATEFMASNAHVVYQWILENPEIVEPIILGSTNLEPAEVDALTPGQTVRIFRVAWQNVREDGLFTEIGGFFGELFPKGPPPPEASPSQAQSPQLETSSAA